VVTRRGDPRCKILIVMGCTNPEAAGHSSSRWSLVPIDTPAYGRPSTSVFGTGPARALRIIYDNVRVPTTTCSARGLRLRDRPGSAGPGRIHPTAWAALGGAERSAGLDG